MNTSTADVLNTSVMKYTGVADEKELPPTTNVLTWDKFNVDLWSN